jgi:cytochrome o ubiquinol oxidase subunit 1
VTLSILCGIVSQVIQLAVSIRNRVQTTDLAGDPWNGHTLEWATSSPPPEYNFAIVPQVTALDAFQAAKDAGTPYTWPVRYEDIEVPRNTMFGMVLGALAFILGFATVWHIWWLAGLGALGVIGAIVARSFVTGTTRIIPSTEVALIETRWRDAIEARKEARQ